MREKKQGAGIMRVMRNWNRKCSELEAAMGQLYRGEKKKTLYNHLFPGIWKGRVRAAGWISEGRMAREGLQLKTSSEVLQSTHCNIPLITHLSVPETPGESSAQMVFES